MSKMYMVIKNSDCGGGNEPSLFETRTDAITYISEDIPETKRDIYTFNGYVIIVDNMNDTFDEYTLYLIEPDTLTIHTLVPTEDECLLLGIKKGVNL